ncbi:hypothetical protein CAEBREN_01885 [Caenorhabditis brenneri]|uniref:Uncharacterized protein n=1 Tax=Caenorhabditis brenneri TaxID=135651 RepID=G0MA70_CAEBE|nr:hypothetical protein CAEBREN_01885 [Caenorhabditis brenneri]
MVVQLILTPAMMKCFHECAEEGNYLQLFEHYEQFFETLKRNLWKVKFSEPLYTAIIKESDFLLNCLSTWVTKTSLPWDQKTVNPDLDLLGFLPRFVLAMQTRNWNDFYNRFLPIIDLLIETARRQEIIDLKIGRGPDLYDTFNLRDMAISPQETQNRSSVICASGHSSPFDCNSNCRRFLRSLYGAQELIDLKIQSNGNLYDSFEHRDPPEQSYFNSFIRKYGSSRHYSSLRLNKNDERPPINFLRRTLSEVRLEPTIEKESRTTTTQKSSKHVRFSEPEPKKAESITRDIPIKLVRSSAPEVKKTVLTGVPGSTRLTQVRQTVPTAITKVKESSTTRVPQVREVVPSRVTVVRQTVPTPLNKVKESGSTRVPEAKESISRRATEVRKSVPAVVPKTKELGSNRAAEAEKNFLKRAIEARKTVPVAIPKVKELGSTRVPEVKKTSNVSPRHQRETLQVNQNEEISILETRIQKLLEKQLEMQIETDMRQKNLETRINFLEENLKTMESNQRTFDQKLQQMESRFESSMETKLKKFGENLTSTISQNKHEDPTKNLELLEEQLQFRELILHQKIDEIKIREQTLDNRMNELMELMESRM